MPLKILCVGVYTSIAQMFAQVIRTVSCLGAPRIQDQTKKTNILTSIRAIDSETWFVSVSVHSWTLHMVRCSGEGVGIQ